MYLRRIDVVVGDQWVAEMPYSEVCMHLGVAGKRHRVQLTARGVQLLNGNGEPISLPVLPGEGGVYYDARGFYRYPTAQTWDALPDDSRAQFAALESLRVDPRVVWTADGPQCVQPIDAPECGTAGATPCAVCAAIMATL